jgi:hypothetical protein
MHYNVSYKNLPEDEKRVKAVLDIKEYLGTERFNKVEADFRQLGYIEPDKFEFLCMIAGIEGYPVGAWYASLFGDDNDRIE